MFLPACVSYRAFAPRENLTATAPNGLPAANYPLADGLGPCGEVRVWAEGDVQEVDGADTAVLHVGIELENRSQQPLRIDREAMRVQAVRSDGGATGEARLLQVDGEAVAPPGRTTRMGFAFAPAGVARARAIQGFEVHWLVRRDGSEAGFEQVTPFGVHLLPPDPWRDGYCGWGPGFGFYGYYGGFGPWHHCR